MFKNEAGQHKFSFTRFMTNAVPNLAGAPQDTELSPHEKDLAFTYQLCEGDPRILGTQAFLHAGVTATPKISASIHKALLSNHVLIKDSPTVDTTAISPKFAHQLSNITSHAQKKLVNFLFFWEEEIQRWRPLMEERDELTREIDAGKKSGEDIVTHEKTLAEVRSMITLKPSSRAA